MKNSILTTVLAVGALALGVQQANAAFINGAISISAPVTPDNDDLTLATSIDIDEANASIVPGTSQGDFNSATAVMSFVSSIMINPTGGLPFQVYVLDNGITLTLTSLTETANNASLITLDGNGVFSGGGFDDTFGDFDITVIKSVSPGGTFVTFNLATTSAVEGRPVVTPDGGASAMLLGLGILGLAALRRK